MTKSALQIARAAYQPKLPKALRGHVKVQEGAATQSVADQEEIKRLFPNTYGMPLIKFEAADEAAQCPAMNVGVILSGGQAPGGHNVISGLFDGIKRIHPDGKLYGFLMGPGGLVDHKYIELTADIIDEYRNTGGFDIIGSGRTKLEKEEQFEKGYEILKELGIKALVIIGGDDSNTNACVLAEYYAAKNYGVQVIGCPKTIDGDLKNDMIETSFGFDTACKTYAEVIGNIQRDCNSARKYWHFIKLMGRSASHIALECALQTQPNVCIVSEEVEAKEDDDLLVFNKPADMPCHQSCGHAADTLANVFAAHCDQLGMDLMYRPLNRLDRDTSGAVLIAKNRFAAASVTNNFHKTYQAILDGVPPQSEGRVDAPIRREFPEEMRRIVSPDGQRAITNYRVLAVQNGYSLVDFVLETGRTHQIRVHMAHLGCPVLGDSMYGRKSEMIARQALHCRYIAFTQPVSRQPVGVSCTMPEDMQEVCTKLGLKMNNDV